MYFLKHKEELKLVNNTIYTIFKKGSKTYFYSSLFFPGSMKTDVFILYSFVRKADDYVDVIPQQIEEFFAFKENYERAINGALSGDIVIDAFVELLERKRFEYEWVDAFLWSMERDLTITTYRTLDDLKSYLYGSAEVVGLMMAKIMNLPLESYPAARYLGRAMQYANFIRDIQEDLMLGRVYFPQEDLMRYNLTSLEYEYTMQYPKEFTQFLNAQINRYCSWQEKAERGFLFIPKRFLIPIKTASEMYKWTASKIRRNPYIIYKKKVKPTIPRILYKIIYNLLTIRNGNTSKKSLETINRKVFSLKTQ